MKPSDLELVATFDPLQTLEELETHVVVYQRSTWRLGGLKRPSDWLASVSYDAIAKGRTMPKKRPEETPEQRKSRIEKTAAERSAAHLAADKAMDDRVKQNIEEHGA